MENEIILKEDVVVKDAIRIRANYVDFDGDLTRWEHSFYQLWRYHLTFGFAHEITIRETRSRGVYVDMLCKPAFKKNILATMEDLGYGNITCDEEKYGEIYIYESSEKFFDLGIETVILTD